MATELYRVIWTDEAIENLEQIVEYVEVFNPDVAARLAERIIFVVDSLSEFPDRGRPVESGLREVTTLVPYIVRYRITGKNVEIIRIRHSARSVDV